MTQDTAQFVCLIIGFGAFFMGITCPFDVPRWGRALWIFAVVALIAPFFVDIYIRAVLG